MIGKQQNHGASSPLVVNGVLLLCVLILSGIVLTQRFRPAANPVSMNPSAIPAGPSPMQQQGADDSPTATARPSTAGSSEISPPNQGVPLLAAEETVIKLFADASPAVVHIMTSALAREYFSRSVFEVPQGSGTGFVWDNQGHVVTNFHVIEEADAVQVALADNSTWRAEIVGVAPEKDVAVLRIDAPPGKLRVLDRGDSQGLRVGQTVLAIGNPFGLDQTLTTGVVSALGREIESRTRRTISNVIQTDAAINPGNSGGPLIGSDGRIIGMTTAIVSPSGAYAGIGFAIPVDTIKWVVPELITHGRIVRPGMAIAVASDSLARQVGVNGALVMGVKPGSEAERAGLRSTGRDRSGAIVMGDVITSIDGHEIRTANDLLDAFEQYQAGQTVMCVVRRAGKRVELSVVLEASE